jgi:phosphate transport system protein
MKRFDNELADLMRRLSDMGELARSMVMLVRQVIKNRSDEVEAQVLAFERQVNQFQTDIDRDAIRMLTVYGPVATDLRQVLVCTHVTSHFERMGDQAVNICEAMRLMRSDPATHAMLPKLPTMADMVCQMVDDALDAYFSRNAEKAAATRRQDDLVDALNDQITADLLTDDVLRNVLNGATDIGEAVAQILVSRYLERIADQATNVCKEVIYQVHGADVRHNRHRSASD